MAISPRIRKAIEESMDRLPEDVRWAVEDFAQGVMAGRAPNLERHTRELYKAFAPLRAVLPAEVTVYRGEPKNPPKIKRKWLSWSPSAAMAAQFGIGTGKHIVEAAVSSKDVIAGILSPHNENYIEYLVWDRPEYHEKGTENPHVYVLSRDWGTYEWTQELHEDESWLEASVRDIERLGGKVLRVRKYDPDEDFAPSIMFVLPSGVSPEPLERDTYDVYDMGESPRHYGKLACKVASRFLISTATYYHGTYLEDALAIERTGFRVSRAVGRGALLGRGVYISGNKAWAEGYARDIIVEEGRDAAFLHLRINPKKPLSAKASEWPEEFRQAYLERVGDDPEHWIREDPQEMGRLARKMGYDAVVYEKGTTAVFDPKIIDVIRVEPMPA